MKDRVVLITGASSGIGKALAEEFGRRGSKLVLGARNLPALSAVAGGVQQQGGQALAVQLDVTQQLSCEAFVAAAVAHFGRVDVLINNAGINMRPYQFVDAPLPVVAQVLQVNFWGAIYCTKAALPYILASKGSVVGISSIAGYRGLPGRTAYSASKFALQGFLEVLRTEMLHQGVHVLTACPGFTESKIREQALNADGQPGGESFRDEQHVMRAAAVAQAIYKAVLHRRRDLILTAQGKATVWLNKLLPGLADRLVYNALKKEPGSMLK